MEKKINTIAILNGKSGSKTKKENKILCSYLEVNGIPYHVTDFPGHAKSLAQKESGLSEILVIGGDGTLHEILSSLKTPFPKIRLLPTGTGNSLARDLGLGSWKTSLPKPYWGEELLIDLMLLNVRTIDGTFSCISASTVCFGFPAKAAQMASRHFKRLKKFCYPVAAGLAAFLNTRAEYEISYDSCSPKTRFLSGGILNHTKHVANFIAFPYADLSDGKFEVIELNAGPVRQSIHNISILTKKYFYDPGYRLKASLANIRFYKKGLLMVDGELYEDVLDFSVTILPGSLRIHALR